MSKHYSKADEEKRKLGHVHENAHDADVEQDSKAESHHEGHATDDATVDDVETNTDDALKKAFGRTSKVTNTRYATVKKWTTYGIGALGLLAVLLIFVGHHHNEANKKEEEKKNRVEKAGAVSA